jgi:hypothetical protein
VSLSEVKVLKQPQSPSGGGVPPYSSGKEKAQVLQCFFRIFAPDDFLLAVCCFKSKAAFALSILTLVLASHWLFQIES